ncbi:MAG TPA: hypothetical protein VGI22_06370 [Xanthobacteraceae bacterium]|jgi:hypothetical protein
MHLHFRYHSQTQRVLHGMPFVLLVCAAGWLTYASDGPDTLAEIGAAFAFGWLFLANLLLNAIVRHRGARFGPIDLSRNVSPTSIEMLLRRLVLIAAFALRVLAAIMSVKGIVRGTEAEIVAAVAVFFLVAALVYGASILAVIVLSGFRIRPVRG